ncbi:hypothetical protein HHI36_012656 [Cryptolaemus montrouzieri]|uniref:Uncharacterized protein n=1 Tax=Cryptolaemus montrouzieri TaxID=559131 RepID=A0ABD2NF55_9CUCU
MRENLNFFDDLVKSHPYNEQFNIKRKVLKTKYKHAIKTAKIKCNDKIIKHSNSSQRAMWSIVNDKRQIVPDKRSSGISPNKFNDFFVGIAKKLINDLGSSVPIYADVMAGMVGIQTGGQVFSFRRI